MMLRFPVQIPLDDLSRLLDFVTAIDDHRHVTDTKVYVISDGAAIFLDPKVKVFMRRHRWIRRQYDVFFDDYWEPTPKARKLIEQDSRIRICPQRGCGRRTVGTPAGGGERWAACPWCIAATISYRRQRNLPIWDRPSRAPAQFSVAIAPLEDALGGDIFKIHPKLEAIIRTRPMLRLSP